MLTFRDVTLADKPLVAPMVQAFYQSDAVDHPVDSEILERSFYAATQLDEPLLRGLMIYSDGALAGYVYVTMCYSAEVGGRCIFIEEIYLKEEFRGKGLGGQIMEWLTEEYPEARRFRLEVTQANQGAIHLYEKNGYQYLNYLQMTLDKP